MSTTGLSGVGETVEYDKLKGPQVKDWLAAVGRAAVNFKGKYGREANAVSIGKDAPDEVLARLTQKGWVVVNRSQPKLHVLVGEVGRWPSPGEWKDAPEDSHLSAVMWQDNTLYVQFRDDSLYEYARVDHLTFRHLVAAPSMGVWLNDNIKGKFKYRRLEGDEAAAVLAGVVAKPPAEPAQKPAPGVYVQLVEPEKDFGYALQCALAEGVAQLQAQGYDPNDVALPTATPGEIVKFLRDEGVNVVSWTPGKPNVVWVGVLP